MECAIIGKVIRHVIESVVGEELEVAEFIRQWMHSVLRKKTEG